MQKQNQNNLAGYGSVNTKIELYDRKRRQSMKRKKVYD